MNTARAMEEIDRVCPITMKMVSEMEEGARFEVPMDPTVYEVDALYEWVFRYHNLVYPHSRTPIPPAEVERLRRMYEALHPPPPPEPVSRSSLPDKYPEPVPDPTRIGEHRFQFHPGNPDMVKRTIQNLAACFVRSFLDRPLRGKGEINLYMREGMDGFQVTQVKEVVASYYSRTHLTGYSLQLVVVCQGNTQGNPPMDVMVELIGDVAHEGRTPSIYVFRYDNRPKEYEHLVRVPHDVLFRCAASYEELQGPNDYTQDLRRFARGQQMV